MVDAVYILYVYPLPVYLCIPNYIFIFAGSSSERCLDLESYLIIFSDETFS